MLQSDASRHLVEMGPRGSPVFAPGIQDDLHSAAWLVCQVGTCRSRSTSDPTQTWVHGQQANADGGRCRLCQTPRSHKSVTAPTTPIATQIAICRTIRRLRTEASSSLLCPVSFGFGPVKSPNRPDFDILSASCSARGHASHLATVIQSIERGCRTASQECCEQKAVKYLRADNAIPPVAPR